MTFRDLTADEIDCRVSTVSEKGCSLLLYKDARVDMNILDETFGIMGWQREHQMIGDRLYCTVKIRTDNGEWISKQDVGTESYTEKEKGQASDSFKRACFNIGIGRELYTAPFIWIGSDKCRITKNSQGKPTTYDRFDVRHIAINNKKITELVIGNTRSGKIVFSYGKTAGKLAPAPKPTMINQEAILTITRLANDQGIELDDFVKSYGVDKLENMTRQQSIKAYNDLIARSKQ
jgi:hypothetical protein